MISTSNARVEVRAGNDNEHAWADISKSCSGYVAVVKFTPEWGGGFFIAHRIEDPKHKALVITPSTKWKGDVENDGWIIEQSIQDKPQDETPLPTIPKSVLRMACDRKAQLDEYCSEQLKNTGPGESPWSREVDDEIRSLERFISAAISQQTTTP